MVASAVIATGALVALPSNAAADTGDTVSSSEIAAALGSTDASNGALVEEPVPSKTDTDSAAVVSQSDMSIEVPKNPEDGVSLQSDGAPEVTIDLPNADASKDAVRLKDGTVAYPGTDGSAQAVVPAEGGVQMLTTIANSDAPTRFAYKVDVPDGGRVEVSPDNTQALVFDGQGNITVAVPAVWAKDANGTAVPTHFESDGKTLTQVVNHTSGNYAYPVVADPFWFFIAGWVLRACGIGFLGGWAGAWVTGANMWQRFGAGVVGCVFKFL
ncbi:hypothetical protein [Streptomyces scabiei]|uniref:hypothetical protein n=1 Tax=Streptomyces scabiei TaxID=1930 RepID=UPI001B344569|nr:MULTISPECIES: hypothetical protein [Streptomyces]MDX2684102.1 hypothetical protein [Streptomyces scabiei]MDX2748901.1 hypothetical protein [Streptomyces scabiei]MDX2803090.1 hypothetical protein [Streptomyces scabiei]MDX3120281.1 hypothetical protein [Streptomyces scabiei]MDX3197559.1 hypothetical protein [Streptomyces scabiei]